MTWIWIDLALSLLLALVATAVLAQRRAPRRGAGASLRLSVVLTHTEGDPPIFERVRRLLKSEPERSVEVVVVGASAGELSGVEAGARRLTVVPYRSEPGKNDKVLKLMAALGVATGDVIVVQDADVVPPEGYLAEIAEAFSSDPRAAVYFFMYSASPGSGWLHRTFLALNGYAVCAPFALLSRLGGALGGLMSVRRSALLEVGGFEALEYLLTEDITLCRKIRAAGHCIHMSHRPAITQERSASLRAVWARWHRWFLATRLYLPGSFWAVSVAEMAYFAWLAAHVFSRAPWAPAGALALIGGRALLGAASALRAGGPVWAAPLAPVLSIAMLPAWLRAVLSRRVAWRDHVFTLDHQGRIVADAGAPAPDLAAPAERALISVVVPTLRAGVPPAARSASTAGLPVVVVRNGVSGERWLDRETPVLSAPVKIVCVSPRGAANARLKALDHLVPGTTHVHFLDDDVEPPPGHYERLNAVTERYSNAVILGPIVQPSGGTFSDRYQAWLQWLRRPSLGGARTEYFVAGNCVLPLPLARVVLTGSGTRYVAGGEEIEHTVHIRRHGAPFVYDESLWVWHRNKPWKELLRTFHRYGRGHVEALARSATHLRLPTWVLAGVATLGIWHAKAGRPEGVGMALPMPGPVGVRGHEHVLFFIMDCLRRLAFFAGVLQEALCRVARV